MAKTTKGKLIVIDGTDGSGKKTQTELLVKQMQKAKFPVASIAFPQYGKKSAGLVEEYLNGKYGKPEEVSPYAASLFYAVDRFDLAPEIKSALAVGTNIITDRYVDANAGHQGGKIRDHDERKRFLRWLYDTEYGLLGIPRPDLVLILHVPAKMGQQLALKKQQRIYIEGGKTLDAHENDLAHLKAAEESYLWLAEQFPENHAVIECVEKGILLTPAKIRSKIWKTVLPIIKAK